MTLSIPFQNRLKKKDNLIIEKQTLDPKRMDWINIFSELHKHGIALGQIGKKRYSTCRKSWSLCTNPSDEMRHKTKYNDEDDLEKGKNDHFKTQLSNYWRQRHTPSNQSETIDKSDGKSSSDCDIHKHVTNKSKENLNRHISMINSDQTKKKFTDKYQVKESTMDKVKTNSFEKDLQNEVPTVSYNHSKSIEMKNFSLTEKEVIKYAQSESQFLVKSQEPNLEKQTSRLDDETKTEVQDFVQDSNCELIKHSSLKLKFAEDYLSVNHKCDDIIEPASSLTPNEIMKKPDSFKRKVNGDLHQNNQQELREGVDVEGFKNLIEENEAQAEQPHDKTSNPMTHNEASDDSKSNNNQEKNFDDNINRQPSSIVTDSDTFKTENINPVTENNEELSP